MISGILNIKKEAGFTSHDVVAKLRGIVHQKKIGHTGTLDPDATGVLPVCFGKATKLCDIIGDWDKTYEAVLLLGKETDTEDTSGKILEEKEVTVTEEEIQNIILSFQGTYDQIPPMYSAKKVNGKKLYELARQGIVIERKPCPVTLSSIHIKKIELPYVTFEVTCSKGTYIRTIIDDAGRALGCGACMTSLRRTKANGFSLADAVPLEEAEKLAGEGHIASVCRSSEGCFENLGRCTVPENGLKFYINGGSIGEKRLSDVTERTELMRAYSENGTFLGLCRLEEGEVKAVWKRI